MLYIHHNVFPQHILVYIKKMLKEHSEWQVGIKTQSVTWTLILEWGFFFFPYFEIQVLLTTMKKSNLLKSSDSWSKSFLQHMFICSPPLLSIKFLSSYHIIMNYKFSKCKVILLISFFLILVFILCLKLITKTTLEKLSSNWDFSLSQDYSPW